MCSSRWHDFLRHQTPKCPSQNDFWTLWCARVGWNASYPPAVLTGSQTHWGKGPWTPWANLRESFWRNPSQRLWLVPDFMPQLPSDQPRASYCPQGAMSGAGGGEGRGRSHKQRQPQGLCLSGSPVTHQPLPPLWRMSRAQPSVFSPSASCAQPSSPVFLLSWHLTVPLQPFPTRLWLPAVRSKLHFPCSSL